MSRVLIVDDESSICWAFRESLVDEGHDVDVAASAEEGLARIEEDRPDALILDVRLPGMDGLAAMDAFRRTLGPVPIVVMTAFGNLDTAVRAVHQGAFEYLVKPFDLDRAIGVVRRALESRSDPGSAGRRTAGAADEVIIGRSPSMQEVFHRIALAASADVPVLITGESGTGKELVARAIHHHGPRREAPFLPICLPALNPGLVEGELFGHSRGSFTGAVVDRKGLLELADGGTVLLDEVGDVPLPIQVKLLRAIERREVTRVGEARFRGVDIRVIAATNRPLGELISAGLFRADLYFRLSVFPIHLPALRDRREDILELAEHFLRRFACTAGVDVRLGDDVRLQLPDRPWQGNVRELRNAVEHAAIVARGQTIRPEHLPPPTLLETARRVPDFAESLKEWATRLTGRAVESDAGGSLYEQYLEAVEPPLLAAVLKRCAGNRAAAAELLGIHRATLRTKLRKYGLD